MNRPMRKLLAFSAAAAMLANIPLMSVNAKYVAEQVGGKEFDTMIQYPDRNLYIENGTANYFDADQQLVVVGTDGTTKLITLSQAIDGGISYASTTMGLYDFAFATTTMGIYDFVAPEDGKPAEFGFNYFDPAYRLSTASDVEIVGINANQVALMDKDGKLVSDAYDEIVALTKECFRVAIDGEYALMTADGKVISELYDSIVPVNDEYFKVNTAGRMVVYDTWSDEIVSEDPDDFGFYSDSEYEIRTVGGSTGIIDKTGKVIIPLQDGVNKISLTEDGKHFFIDGEVQDYYTDLSGEAVSEKYEQIKDGYIFKKDGKFGVLSMTTFQPVTELYASVSARHITEYDYTTGERKSFQYRYELVDIDEEGNSISKYVNENGEPFVKKDAHPGYSSLTLSGKDDKDYSYLIKKTANDDGTNTYIIADTDEKELLEVTANSYGNVGYHKGLIFLTDDTDLVYDAKLELLGEFDSFSTISSKAFAGVVGDKYTIYNESLEIIKENASPSVSAINDYNNLSDGRLYYTAKTSESIATFDENFEPVDEKELGENQWYTVNTALKLFVYDRDAYDRVQSAGENFCITEKDEGGRKLVDSDGNTVMELDDDMNVTAEGYMFTDKDGVITFYDKDGNLIHKFNASYGSKNISGRGNGMKTLDTLTDIIMNDKDSDTGKTVSYIYDLTTDTVKYTQSGKYDMVDMIYEDNVRVINYPDSEPDSELWTSNKAYEMGLVRLDGTEIVAPASNQDISFEDYCNGSASSPDYRDLAIDVIYNNAPVSEWRLANEPFLNPPGTAEDVGTFVVFRDVYIPLKDLDPDFAHAHGYGTAIKLQYGTYVVIKDGKWGIADADGNALCELWYDRICEFADGIAWTTVYQERTMIADQDIWVSSLDRVVKEGEEYTAKVAALGLITKDGWEIVPPYYDNSFRKIMYSSHYDIEHFGSTYFTRQAISAEQYRFKYNIYKGSEYFNDFTAKYGYDTAVQYGDLWLVSKDSLYGVVTADNEEVLPLEFTEVLWFPASEKIAAYKLSKEDAEALSDPHYSSAISELGDGSKLINVKTPEGKVRAYRIRDVEETTTTTTETTTTTTTTTTATTTTTTTTTTTETTTTTTETTTTTTSQPTTTTTTSQPTTTTTTETTTTTTTTTTTETTTTSQPTTTTTTETTTTAATTDTEASTTESQQTTTVTTAPEQKADPRFVGTWTVSRRIDAEGSEDEGWTTLGDGRTLKIRFVLNDDFTGTFGEVDEDGEYQSNDISWTLDDNVLSINADGTEIKFTVEENTLFYAGGFDDGKDYYFKRDGDTENALGDVDEDGSVSAKDASAILVEYSKLSTGADSTLTDAQKAAADVNGDGKTDAKDASAILAYYSYLSTGGTDSLKAFLKA